MTRHVCWLLAVVLCLAGCTSSPSPEPEPTPPPAIQTLPPGVDPGPVLPPQGRMLDSAGGTHSQDGVSVAVPAGAVAEGSSIDVRVGAEIGTVIGTFITEVAGRPVSVEHTQPLKADLTVSWEVPPLTEQQRDSVLLARWDPELRVWKASTVEPRWSGTTLSADIQDFSIWDWFADVNQTVGSFGGVRVDEPTCSKIKLPTWVRGTVDPDEDLAASAIRVCFETDKDERVTVRVANNRPFSQLMRMTRGDQEWAWTWRGDGHALPDIVVYPSAHDYIDTGRRYLLPPLSTQAVGVARPARPGSHHIQAEAVVNWQTVLVDVITYGVDQLPIGGTDNPALNAFLQVMFECGGKQAAEYQEPKDLLAGVVEAIGGCATEIVKQDSEFSHRFVEVFAKLATKAKMTPAAAEQAGRAFRHAAHVFKYIEYAKVVWYLSDQFANAKVGPLYWSVRGNGRQPTLGDWTATCTDRNSDSDRLYRNISLRDEFADTSKELHRFRGLPKAAREAAKPLRSCSASYRAGLAAFLPTDWGDAKAARIVAVQLVDTLPETTENSLRSAVAPAMCEYPSYRMVDGQVPSNLISPGFVGLTKDGGVSGTNDSPLSVDLDGDGNLEVVGVFTCGRGGVSWPNVIGVYGPGPTLLGSADLLDLRQAEHSDITSMSPSAGAVDLRWKSYEGAGFDVKEWRGRLELRSGKVRLTGVRQN